MKITRALVTLAFALALFVSASVGRADAPPVGTYTGKLTSKIYHYNSTAGSSLNITVTLTINANGSWTLVGPDFNAAGQSGIYGTGTVGLFAHSLNNDHFTAPLRFATNGKVQGTIHWIFNDLGLWMLDGKLNLKKN
jgi:hypothetical protein